MFMTTLNNPHPFICPSAAAGAVTTVTAVNGTTSSVIRIHPSIHLQKIINSRLRPLVCGPFPSSRDPRATVLMHPIGSLNGPCPPFVCGSFLPPGV